MDKINEVVRIIGTSEGVLLTLLPAFMVWKTGWEKLAKQWESNPIVMMGLSLMQSVQAGYLNPITEGWQEIRDKFDSLFTGEREVKETLALTQMDFDYWDLLGIPENAFTPEIHAIMIETMVLWDQLSRDIRKLWAKQDDHTRGTMAGILMASTRKLRDEMGKVWTQFSALVR